MCLRACVFVLRAFVECRNLGGGGSRKILNRDTETHLQFSVLFLFFYINNMVITISQPELYQGASHKTRMHQHTDGKTFVNIIMGQCFLDISTPVTSEFLHRHPLMAL